MRALFPSVVGVAIALHGAACGGSGDGVDGEGGTAAVADASGSVADAGGDAGTGGASSGARAAVSGVLLEDDLTNPDNVSLEIGDAHAMPPVHVADGDVVNGSTMGVRCSVAHAASGSTVSASVESGSKVRFAIDAVTIAAGGVGTTNVRLVQPQNGVQLASLPAMPCEVQLDPDAPTPAEDGIRVEIACDEVASDEHGIHFGLDATLDLAGCDTAPGG